MKHSPKIGVGVKVPGDREMIIVMQDERDAREYYRTLPKGSGRRIVRMRLEEVRDVR